MQLYYRVTIGKKIMVPIHTAYGTQHIPNDSYRMFFFPQHPSQTVIAINKRNMNGRKSCCSCSYTAVAAASDEIIVALSVVLFYGIMNRLCFIKSIQWMCRYMSERLRLMSVVRQPGLILRLYNSPCENNVIWFFRNVTFNGCGCNLIETINAK